MGLIKAALGAAGGVMADQWKEFFVCDSLPNDVLMRKGQKKTTGRSSNYKGDENIITSGSGIVVAAAFDGDRGAGDLHRRSPGQSVFLSASLRQRRKALQDAQVPQYVCGRRGSTG